MFNDLLELPIQRPDILWMCKKVQIQSLPRVIVPVSLHMCLCWLLKWIFCQLPNLTGRFTSISSCNLTKVRPLFTLSHRGSDNSPLLIVFKWTLYELCLCIYYIMISTNQITYFKRSAVFVKMTKSLSLLPVALHHDLANQIAYFKRSAVFLKMMKSFSLLLIA